MKWFFLCLAIIFLTRELGAGPPVPPSPRAIMQISLPSGAPRVKLNDLRSVMKASGDQLYPLAPGNVRWSMIDWSINIIENKKDDDIKIVLGIGFRLASTEASLVVQQLEAGVYNYVSQQYGKNYTVYVDIQFPPNEL